MSKDYYDYGHRLSHSQFKTYRECPRKWQHKYREGRYPSSHSEHFIFGTAVHEAIQGYLEAWYGEDDTSEYDIHDELRIQLRDEFESDLDDFEGDEFPVTKKRMVELYHEGIDLLDNFLAVKGSYFDPENETLAGIETRLLEPTDVNENVAWLGYIDVLLKSGDKWRIVDLKTSTKGWGYHKKKDKKTTDQLLAYKLFFAKQEGVDPYDVDVEYVILAKDNIKSKKLVESFVPEDEIERVDSEVNKFVSEAFDESGEPKQDVDHPKNPDKWNCCFCPFSKQFGDEGHKICDHPEYDGYPESMRPYVPDQYVG